MEFENQWLEKEMDSILHERKKVKLSEGCRKVMTTFLIFVTIFFCPYEIEAAPNPKKIVESGVWWICPTCRTAQWQAAKNANWLGEFFCHKCGQKK